MKITKRKLRKLIKEEEYDRYRDERSTGRPDLDREMMQRGYSDALDGRLMDRRLSSDERYIGGYEMGQDEIADTHGPIGESKITKRQLKRIIREAEGSTKKYDDDSALKGGQSKLPDGLQKGIIDKSVEDREEHEEEEREEKNESLQITKRQLRKIIREYKEMLSPAHIDGQPWSGTLEDLAVVQSKTWGHGEVVDSKGYKDIVNHARDLTAGKAKSPIKKYGK